MAPLKQRDALVLADMIEAADRTLQKAECGKDALMSDPDARDMVIHNPEHLCESASTMSVAFVKEHRRIPWHQLGELRNGTSDEAGAGGLVHHDGTLDLDDTWEFVTTGLPDLLNHLKRVQERTAR